MLSYQRRKNILPEFASLTNKYNLRIIDARKEINSAVDTDTKKQFEVNLENLLLQKRTYEDLKCDNLRDKVIDYITNNNQSIRLKRISRDSREITVFNRATETLTVFDKLCANSLRKAFQLTTHSRDRCIRALRDALSVAAPGSSSIRSMYRYDIEEFYKSIPHQHLLERIENHQGVPQYIKKHIENILSSYRALYGISRGIPEGIASSAALAEIYFQRFDQQVLKDNHVVLYLRYVDDIVIIVDRTADEGFSLKIRQLITDLDLRVNDKKSKEIHHPINSETTIEYLGYKFSFEISGSLSLIDISDNKFSRYMNALNKIGAIASAKNCWSDRSNIDLILEAFEYLFFTHKSIAEFDGFRIVSGLGYSSKFIKFSSGHKNKSNFSKLISQGESTLKQIYGKSTQGGTKKTCSCCNKSLYRMDDLKKLKETLSWDSVLFHQARPNQPESIKKEISDLLWK